MKAQDVFDLMHRSSCWEFPEQSGKAKLMASDRTLFEDSNAEGAMLRPRVACGQGEV